MREITLSDFVGGRIRKAQGERAKRHAFELRAHERGAPGRAKAGVAVAVGAMLVGVSCGILTEGYHPLRSALHWVISALDPSGHVMGVIYAMPSMVVDAILFAVPASALYALWQRARRPEMRAASDQENILKAGQEGEEKAAKAFAAILDDDWVMLKGYKNPKGEIDQILVGPGGVTAIEIKNYTGVMHINGDSWTRRRVYYDSAGVKTVAEPEPVHDAGGRAPSRQLNEPASQLQQFLRSKRSGVKRVNRAVILTDNRSQIGPVFGLTVDHVVTLNDMRRRNHYIFVFGDGRARLDGKSVERISNLIAQNHNYHNKSHGKRKKETGKRKKNRRRHSA